MNEFTTVKLGEDGYQMKIKHFSEFKADLNLEPEAPLAKADSIVKTTTIGKNNDNEGSTDITIKYNYTEGVIYENLLKMLLSKLELRMHWHKISLHRQ